MFQVWPLHDQLHVHACLTEEAKKSGKKVTEQALQLESKSIHSKKWIPWIPESAENFEFSAERLGENQKTVNSSMNVRNKPKLLQIITNHYQSLPSITNYYQL